MNLCDPNQIKAILAHHGFHFSRSLGQNFLIEDWVPTEIAQESGADRGTGVLEIGPGIGTLTRYLTRLADQVVSVELDSALLPILGGTMAEAHNFTLIHQDILKANLPEIVETHFQGLRPLVCANLPYNITSPVISLLLESGLFQQITVMVQKEVAQRISAPPGASNYGSFSVYCQYHSQAELLFDVPPSCFMPAPKVTSAVLRLTPHSPPDQVDDPKHFFQVVKAAFAQRRKTLENSLSATLPNSSKDQVAQAIAQCGLPADVRGQRLSIPDFARLSQILRQQDAQKSEQG